MIQAQYVRAGMAVADAKGSYDIVREVELHEPESRTVYDLDVEDSHNFVANGICTHNSIYAFRGANVGNMADFEREFRVQNLIKLEQNYRSGGHILNAANALISNNRRRLGKDLWTDAGEGEPVRIYEAQTDGYEAAWMVEEIKSLIAEGHSRGEIAILYRSNAQSRVIEHALFNAAIPYRVYGGLRFFERAEVKHALAYLRLIENPADDTAFLRVVNFPPRGIGARTLEQLGDAARESGQTLYAAVGAMTGKAKSNLTAFVKLIDTLRTETADLPLSEIVDAVIQQSGLIAHYQAEKEGEERIENLNELVNAAAAFVMEEGYDAGTPGTQSDAETAQLSPLAGFLSHASLEAGDNQAEAGQDALQTDDRAFGQRARVLRGVYQRARGGPVSARKQHERTRWPRRGTPLDVRRDHARAAAVVYQLCAEPDAARPDALWHQVAIYRRAARGRSQVANSARTSERRRALWSVARHWARAGDTNLSGAREADAWLSHRAVGQSRALRRRCRYQPGRQRR